MPQTFTQYFRSLQVIFFALLAGQILMTAVIYTVEYNPQERQNPDTQLLTQLFPFLGLIMAALAFFLSRKKLEAARQQATLKDKLSYYRTASILKWAPLEGVTLLSIVLFFVTGNILFLGFASASIIYFATQFPSRQRLINELDLSASEQTTLDDPNAEVAESRNYRNYTN